MDGGTCSPPATHGDAGIALLAPVGYLACAALARFSFARAELGPDQALPHRPGIAGVYGALRAGASGFLLKDTPPAELLAGIRVVAAGEGLLAPTVTRRLIDEFARRPEPARPLPRRLG